jgi:hypothetical protein
LVTVAPFSRVRVAALRLRPKFGATTARLMLAVLLRVPDVPVIVMTDVPATAELAAASVRVLLLVVLAGLHVAVTPVGIPVATNPTLPVNPPWGTTVTVEAPLAPEFTVMLAAEAVMLKFGVATTRLMVAVLLSVPDVPVIVMAEVPATAELAAASVRVLILVELAALHVAVTPAGIPVATNATLPVKPFC